MSVRSHPFADSPPLSGAPRWTAEPHSFPSHIPDTDTAASNPLAFGLFLLLNAVLFVRPSEIFPDLAEIPIYNIVIIPCIVASLPTLLFGVLRWRVLVAQPIILCVLGLLPLAFLSLVGRLNLEDTKSLCWEYAKVLIYFLLLLANVGTPSRIRTFMGWLVVYIAVLTGLALLQWHEVIEIPGLKMCREEAPDPEGSGLMIYLYRLQATGIFNDPNDLCLALGMGIMICLYRFGDKRLGMVRGLWLTPIVLFGYALYLTQSRGGLLGVSIGALLLFQSRYGWRKAVLLAVLCSPGLFLLSGMRQGNLELSQGTGQTRIQLWSEGFALFKQSPLRGIGWGQYAEQIGQVAHNSYVHSFVELGFLGGVLFVGAWYVAAWSLYKLSAPGVRFADSETRRLRPFMLALAGAYAGGLYSLSRVEMAPTYLVLGLAGAYISTATRQALPVLEWSPRLFGRLVLVGVIVLAVLYLFIRVFASYG
jgi:putative inorganic carbon (hco3(-)) transporter